MTAPAEAWIEWLASARAGEVRSVVAILGALGLRVTPGANGPGPGIVAVDLGADAGSAADLAGVLADRAPHGKVLALVLSEGPSEHSWTLLKQGASDVIHWNGGEAAAAVVARLTRWREVEDLVESPEVRGELLGWSPAWRRTMRQVVEIARFSQASVLLTGESGTGKEGVARLIHRLDPRDGAKGDLVLVDCTTVVPGLSGSEFFGHERGSFTGAVAQRDGAFALANGGTLFLDEVGDLPVVLQAELLRVVQEGMFKRIGSNVWLRTSFRLVCATHRDLHEQESAGTFRRDLYYRIAAALIRLPPLRARPEDIVPLFRCFLAEFLEEPQPAVDAAVEVVLRNRAYPGNVRDLRQLALRVSARHVGPGPITPGDLPEDEWPERLPDEARPAEGDADSFEAAARRALARGATLREVREAAADAAIAVAMAENGGQIRRAAARLGVTERAMQLRRANQRRAASTNGD